MHISISLTYISTCICIPSHLASHMPYTHTYLNSYVDSLIYVNTRIKAALDVHKDIKAKHSFGIHWGTFPLAGDAWNEGARELIQVCMRTHQAKHKTAYFRPFSFFIEK